MASYDITCVLRGSLPTLYSLGARVTSRLDLGDNQKVITDYRNHGIICILTHLVVSSGYLPGILRDASSSAVPRKTSSCGLGRHGGATHMVCRGYLGSYPPHSQTCMRMCGSDLHGCINSSPSSPAHTRVHRQAHQQLAHFLHSNTGAEGWLEEGWSDLATTRWLSPWLCRVWKCVVVAWWL